MLSMNFSLQNDKSIDIGGHAQLTSGIWVYHHKQLIFRQQLMTYFVLLKTDCSGKPALMQPSAMEK